MTSRSDNVPVILTKDATRVAIDIPCQTGPGVDLDRPAFRVALLGNPNTGKTTLFNRFSGLRHKTSNFPGTTQEARIGLIRVGARGAEQGSAGEGAGTGSTPVTPGLVDAQLIDLPGIYSIELDMHESAVCREVLAGNLAPKGEPIGAPNAALIVVDATNLPRNLLLVGEVLRRRLPTVVAINMIDLARKRGIHIDRDRLADALGCAVFFTCARSGEGIEEVRAALADAKVPNRTPPGQQDALERWADEIYAQVAGAGEGPGGVQRVATDAAAVSRGRIDLTDRLDRVVTHPILGMVAFLAVMAGLFWSIFSLAQLPMGLIEQFFAVAGGWAKSALPDGLLRDLLCDGVLTGIGSTAMFLPQICLLFFLIALLEDTGYLARAAFLMDRWLRPFGLPGHAFVPLLSSHACALPGIMACRGIPDRRERLATILVAPFMTCSARLPVYVLVTTLLFRDRPLHAALAFIGCYALGALAGVFSALVFRRTILRGRSRPMALELPTYKLPSLRTALLTTYDRGMMFLKNAGTNILAICIVLWWLGTFPHTPAPAQAVQMREQAAAITAEIEAGTAHGEADQVRVDELTSNADAMERQNALFHSYAGKLGRRIEPLFAPLGFDWQLCIGVVTSFAAREVFVSTMAVTVAAGSDDAEDQGVLRTIGQARRSDGVTPIFTPAVCWSLLVYYVLAMQCLPTLAVTAREAGGTRWALLQLGWMTGLAYIAAAIAFRIAS
jgi:ferrous iron transport protein B